MWTKGHNTMQYNSGHDAILQNTRGNVLADVNPLLRLVYLWMTVGLVVTGIVAAVVASNIETVFSIANAWIVIIIAQFALVIGISWGISRVSPAVATILFLIYSGTVGLTVGVAVFVALYSTSTGINPAVPDITPVAQAFFTTAGLFGVMT